MGLLRILITSIEFEYSGLQSSQIDAKHTARVQG